MSPFELAPPFEFLLPSASPLLPATLSPGSGRKKKTVLSSIRNYLELRCHKGSTKRGERERVQELHWKHRPRYVATATASVLSVDSWTIAFLSRTWMDAKTCPVLHIRHVLNESNVFNCVKNQQFQTQNSWFKVTAVNLASSYNLSTEDGIEITARLQLLSGKLLICECLQICLQSCLAVWLSKLLKCQTHTAFKHIQTKPFRVKPNQGHWMTSKFSLASFGRETPPSLAENTLERLVPNRWSAQASMVEKHSRSFKSKLHMDLAWFWENKISCSPFRHSSF